MRRTFFFERQLGADTCRMHAVNNVLQRRAYSLERWRALFPPLDGVAPDGSLAAFSRAIEGAARVFLLSVPMGALRLQFPRLAGGEGPRAGWRALMDPRLGRCVVFTREHAFCVVEQDVLLDSLAGGPAPLRPLDPETHGFVFLWVSLPELQALLQRHAPVYPLPLGLPRWRVDCARASEIRDNHLLAHWGDLAYWIALLGAFLHFAGKDAPGAPLRLRELAMPERDPERFTRTLLLALYLALVA